MGISLKEQLNQVNQLHEMQYHAPIFDKNYYDQQDHSVGKKAGKRMFYDFYAMEFLWAFLGSGQIPKSEREKMLAMPEDDPQRDIIRNKAHRFLPSSAVKTIDSMYEQVTNAVAKNLLAYTRLAVVQEFQYLVSQSYAWTAFRNSIVAKYNTNKKITKEDFDHLVKKHIPEMAPFPESIKRLLKYSKYYSEMHTMDDKDPSDVTRKVSVPPKEDDVAPTEFPNGQSSEEPSTPSEPDDTDYNAEPTSREFGKYGGPGQPESPYKTDWSGMSSFNDTGELPQVPDDDDESDEKQSITEEYINLTKVKRVYSAINDSGVTLDDIEKAYNKVPWGGSYGGPKWGAGAVALLKLANAKTKLTTEDMNHIIDHIYDLQHNTGSLLNKGPMYISDTDLNRRYKITDIARFIPFVSPVIKNLILRFQKYLHKDPARAELESKMEDLLKSPTVQIDSEDVKKLTDLGFKSNGLSYRIGIKFNNKKGDPVYGVYYEISKHNIGTFDKGNFILTPNASPMYVVSDNLQADVRAFPTFNAALEYLNSHKHEMVPNADVSGTGNSSIKSQKDIYIESHTKIKLNASKEQLLLGINMGWRKKGCYYKAYFADGHRALLYAFSDSTFFLTRNDTPEYFIYNSWEKAFVAAGVWAAGAQEYPEKAQNQADINHALGIPSTSSPSNVPEPSTIKKYFLDDAEVSELYGFISSINSQSYPLGFKAEGIVVVSHYTPTKTDVKFGVGKYMDTLSHNPYVVIQYKESNKTQSWTFNKWSEAFNFIKSNINVLIQSPLVPGSVSTSTTPSSYDISGKQMPSNATSKAVYTAHVGIQSKPKNTIRLTKEDESALLNIGFEPRLVSGEVWYIHKGSGDTVKFFPNNTAKVLFTSKSGSNVPGINGEINKILAWLPTKYMLSTTKSPINGPSTVSKSATTAPTSGIKAGTMFEKTISDAGFVWDSMAKNYINYHDKKTFMGPVDVLTIAPDRSSTLEFNNGVNGGELKFKDLASLIAYIKGDYIQKKSKPITPGPEKITVYPTWLSEKLVGLMEKNGFKYAGPISDDGYKYKTSGGDIILTYPNNYSKVLNASIQQWLDFTSEDELITYLYEKYGSLGSSTNEDSDSYLYKKLDQYGFKKVGPTMDGGNGIKKSGIVFDDSKHNRVVYYVDGSSNAYINDINSPKFGMSVASKNVSDLLGFLTSMFGGETAGPYKGKSISISDNFKSKLVQVGFGEVSDANGIGYTHGTDFVFRVLPHTNGYVIQWTSPNGVKEFATSQYNLGTFLSSVLNLITLSMKGDQIDYIFSEKTQGEEDKLLNSLIEEAAKYHGVGGYLKMGASFENDISSAGFEWYDYNGVYVNESLGQVLLIVQINNRFVYHLFYIAWDLKTKHEQIQSKDVFTMIGPNGEIEKEKKIQRSMAKGTSPGNLSVVEPSGETYKTEPSGANLKYIKLNEHDEKLMEYCGFKFTPSENRYYKNKDGNIFRFYNNGTADFYEINEGLIGFKTIPHALKFAVAKYISNTNPSAGENSNTSPFRVQATNKAEKLLGEKYGYSWHEGTKQYVKNDGPLNTIIFTSDGKIYYYPSGSSGQSFVFNSELELFSQLDKDGSLKKENLYRSIIKTLI